MPAVTDTKSRIVQRRNWVRKARGLYPHLKFFWSYGKFRFLQDGKEVDAKTLKGLGDVPEILKSGNSPKEPQKKERSSWKDVTTTTTYKCALCGRTTNYRPQHGDCPFCNNGYVYEL